MGFPLISFASGLIHLNPNQGGAFTGVQLAGSKGLHASSLSTVQGKSSNKISDILLHFSQNVLICR